MPTPSSRQPRPFAPGAAPPASERQRSSAPPPPNPRTGPGARDPLIDWLAWLMDNSIQVGPWRIGLDGLVGLLPGAGDLATGAVSMIIILRAAAAGVPRVAVARMVANVAIDSLLGMVPVLGDLFDMAYKSNLRNQRIYYESLTGERDPRRDWAFLVGVGVVLLAIISLPILVLAWLIARFGMV
jgi:hypothetical protein